MTSTLTPIMSNSHVGPICPVIVPTKITPTPLNSRMKISSASRKVPKRLTIDRIRVLPVDIVVTTYDYQVKFSGWKRAV